MGNSTSHFDYEAQLLADPKDPQSRVVRPEEKDKGYGPVYRSTLIDAEGPLPSTITHPVTGEEGNTVFSLYNRGMAIAGDDGRVMGTRLYKVAETPIERTEEELKALPKNYVKTGYVERSDGTVDRFEYVWDTYKESLDTSVSIGRGLRSLGLVPEDNVGIFSINRTEWMLSALGIYSQSMRIVSLYPTLGPNAVEYIINHSTSKVCIVTKENFNQLIKSISNCPSLEHIILIDCIYDGKYGNTLDVVTDKHRQQVAALGKDIKIHGLSEIIKLGQTGEYCDKEPAWPKGDNIAYIMYTSGTTGTPKGVMITHANIAATLCVVHHVIKPEPWVYFSYLPLSHIFEALCQHIAWLGGGCVAFSQGDIRRLVDDLRACRPEFMPGVPRVWQKFYQGAFASIDKKSCLLRWYIHRAYNYQISQLRQGLPLDPSYDNNVFSKIRDQLGINNLRLMINGAAPCPPYLVEFMRVVSNAWFTQGYGLTESCAGTSVSLRTDYTVGSVGAPLPSVEFRLADIPDMGYLTTNEPPTGELLIHGGPITLGYYKNQEETDKTYITDGQGYRWLCTGDVARLNPNGTFSIIDRKKNLLKLSQGEYVSLEKVEDTYGQSALVGQIWCYGNSYKSQMVGVVVPNVQPLYDYCISKGWWKCDQKPVIGSLSESVIHEFERIAKAHHDEIVAWIQPTLKNTETGLNGYEKIKKFIIDCRYDELGQVFNEQRETLTPTMKKKRIQLVKFYSDELKSLYTAIGEPPQDGERW